MDCWHEIVKRYDDSKSKDPHGAYSQSSVVILLIYLTFGRDHPYSISKFFKKMCYKPLDPDVEIPYYSNLKIPKIYTLLERMRKDELVTVTELVVKGRTTKIYSINPRIIQSPSRSGTYLKRDGSTFEIPLEMVEEFLPWRDLQWEEHVDWSGRDGFFKHVVFDGNTIDFLFFIRILELLARQQNQDVESNWGRYCEPCAFEKLLEEYDTLIVDYYDELSRDPSRNYVNPFKNTKNETRSR